MVWIGTPGNPEETLATGNQHRARAGGVEPAEADRPDAAHLRGFALLSGGQLFARALTVVAITYLARALGVEMFGAVGFAAAVVSYFLICVDAGLDLVAMRDIARQRSSLEDVITAVLAARLLLSVLVGVLLWLSARWFSNSLAGAPLILAYGLTFFSLAVNLKAGFQGIDAYGEVATALVFSQAAYLAGVLLLVQGPADAIRVPLLLFGSELAGDLFLLAQYRRCGFGFRFPLRLGFAYTLLKTAAPLGAARWLRTLQLNFDILLLSYLAAPRTVGIYVAVTRITLLLRELAETYSLPLLTGLSASAAQDSRAFVSRLQTGLRYAAVLILPITVGGCLSARKLLSIVFGPGYAAGAAVLGILLAAVFFVVLAGPYRMGLIAHGRQKSLLWITGAGATLSVGLNAVLIPRYSMLGAGFSALVSEVFVFVLCLALLSRIVAVSAWRPVLAPAAAAAGMGVALWFLPDRSFALTASIGAATYVLLALVFRAIRPHELLKVLRWQSPAATPEAPRSLP